ncbi:uncharacterized protein TNCV_4542281 [Trichonephila clavipes]|nr:uncharacterized protein TNCV_4542281 [Trichonephila clavipes]
MEKVATRVISDSCTLIPAITLPSCGDAIVRYIPSKSQYCRQREFNSYYNIQLQLFFANIITNSNSVAQQPMRAKAYCAHPSIRDHMALRCMSRCPDQVVSQKRDPQCLSPQTSLVLIYRPIAVGMKG